MLSQRAVAIDGMSVFSALLMGPVKPPPENSMAGHLCWLVDQHRTKQIDELAGSDDRDVRADPMTKGNVAQHFIPNAMVGHFAYARAAVRYGSEKEQEGFSPRSSPLTEESPPASLMDIAGTRGELSSQSSPTRETPGGLAPRKSVDDDLKQEPSSAGMRRLTHDNRLGAHDIQARVRDEVCWRLRQPDGSWSLAVPRGAAFEWWYQYPRH